jgi:hypothetical protein
MLKGFTVSAVVVALLSSTAGAWPSFQVQHVDMDLVNGVLLVGDGGTANTNLLTVGESQLATDDVRHTTAFQGFNGALTQTAAAVGSNGISGALQYGDLTATQVQNPDTGQQSQQVDSDLDQSVYKVGGNGSVLGIESAVGIGTQLIFTTYGATANVQAIGDVVYSAAGGGPSGSTTINGGSSINLGQTQ